MIESKQADSNKMSVGFGLSIVGILFMLVVALVYYSDRPKFVIDEDMLGTDNKEGKVLYIGAGQPAIRVDYQIQSTFGRPIGKVNYLVDVSTPNMLEFQDFADSAKFVPAQVLRFRFIPDPPTTNFHGWLYIRANPDLKLEKGETRFVTMRIYADWFEDRPEGMTDQSTHYTTELIGTVKVKIYG